VFGEHNLLNMEAARLAVAELGINTQSFAAAIADFTGAAKRLEVMMKTEGCIVFRDFAHAPSKVKATLQAVRQQFPDRKLIALLELHTYSSLNADFMPHYAHAMDGADEACVCYSDHALAIKKMPPLDAQLVREGFERNDLAVYSHRDQLQAWIEQRTLENACVLLMSSGNFDGVDVAGILQKAIH
jgi:UDP-N-acetylmuramate: L-alanyl-gamma-D-glutamyl-meso-diaminopimelate ligase